MENKNKQRCPCCGELRTSLYTDERNNGNIKICIFCLAGYGGQTKEIKVKESDRKILKETKIWKEDY